jgi:acyl-CoA reductase-like NAD-dependent aldehyde dehydrogenase
VLGALQNNATLERIDDAARQGLVVHASKALEHPAFAAATVQTPIVVRVEASREDVYTKEMFGPITYLIPTADTEDAIARATMAAKTKGAITAAVYSTDAKVLEAAQDAAADAGVSLSCNLTGGIYVNQSAAFSDYHASGCNPAANASLTDAAFVAPRFHVVQARIPVAA